MHLPYAVYTLKSADGLFFTRLTQDLNKSIKEHRRAPKTLSSDRLPGTLVHVAFFAHKRAARRFERYLNSGAGEAFKRRYLM